MLKKNPLPILLGVLALLLIGRFAGPALLPILRGVLIAAAVYFLYNKVRSIFIGTSDTERIIDLCPHCGTAIEAKKRHSCSV
ncbi:MAG: hypothetical protein KBD78_05000 [Oligoflexales bacterium]|nr:hypothetical protein [Oligoflexales bacterium]